MPPEHPPRVLVVNPFGIGDVIFSFALIEAVRRARPHARIGYFCNERTRELVEMNPSVGRTHEFGRDRLRGLLRSDKAAFLRELAALRRGIREARYDVALDLSLGREYAFLLWLSGVKRRIGFDYKGRGIFLTDRVTFDGYEGRPVREKHLELFRRWLPGEEPKAGYPEMKSDPSAWQAWSAARGIRPGDFVAVVAPGGGKSWGRDAGYKQWGPERFARVAAHLARTRGARVVVAGDGGEKALCDRVRDEAGVPGVETMAGEPLAAVMGAMRAAGVFVGNDGGLLHLADLAGAPVVGIYGPVDERAYGPLPRPGAEAVKKDVPCRPCYRRFRFPPCPHGKRCLEELEMDDVLDAIERVAAHKRHSRESGNPI